MEEILKTIGKVFQTVGDKGTTNSHLVEKVFNRSKFYTITTDNQIMEVIPHGIHVEKGEGRIPKISFAVPVGISIGRQEAIDWLPAENVFLDPLQAYEVLLKRLDLDNAVPTHLLSPADIF